MSAWQFIVRSLAFHWRINAAVALGVAAATAVLTGALLVGDSVRGSLRHLALDRLGRIDEILVADRFFRAELAAEVSSSRGFVERFDAAVPAMMFPHAAAEHRAGDQTRRASGVLVIGAGERFWMLGDTAARPLTPPGADQVVLNEPLAADLGVQVGDEVVLRLPQFSQVSADSALGEKEDQVRSIPALKVVAIVPAASLGRFSLRSSQSVPRNAYVSLDLLQDRLRQPGQVNAILVAGNSSHDAFDKQTSVADSAALAGMLQPTFEDYGFNLKHVRQTFQNEPSDQPQVIFDYYSLTSDKMLLPPAAEVAAEHAFAADHGQPVLTYLANTIAKADANDNAVDIPYSLITAIEFTPQFPLTDAAGQPIEPLEDEQIVLNAWAAKRVGAKVDDRIRVDYFEPETAHGREVERSAEFTLAAITPLTQPHQAYDGDTPAQFDQPPTLANDPDLTPEVEGFTDQQTISDADPPFPFDRMRLQPEDDVYWEYHRTTPKAFVSLAAGQRLWGSRFGQVTSFRIPAAAGVDDETLQTKLLAQIRRDNASLGMSFTAIKRESWIASSGTTPFDVLFLALSMFIIAAALMLVSLLFRLGVEQRAAELGILLAVGLRRRKTMLMFVAEGLLVAAIGGAIGVAGGIGYAALMLAGLHAWWLGAISTPFLEFYVTAQSLAIGYGLGVLFSGLAIAWSIRQTRRISARRLMSGQAVEQVSATARPRRIPVVVATVLLIAAGVLAVMATRLGGEAQAGAFVGSGAAVLSGLLTLIWSAFRSAGGRSSGALGLLTLAARSAGRNANRSTLTIGLMAFASFLIVAMSSFRMSPSEQGVGGFELLAESSTPILEDLNDPAVRDDLLADRAAVLQGGEVLSLRLKPGDDASCNNLYQATQPRVLGVTPQFIQHFDDPSATQFGWGASAAETPKEKANPWQLLSAPREPGDGAIPVVIDKNTAMYSLKLYQGIGEEYRAAYDDGPELTFRVVGLLSNSILQGSLLIGEEDFKRAFPNVSGYRYFLIDPPAGQSQAVTDALEERLGDSGFDVFSSRALLQQLLAVQNTYLSTFQSLGALGLLLGTFGLATVQLRSVLERRGELALMRASGWRPARLAQMVLAENAILLLGGLATGVVSALLAVLPHMAFSQASMPGRDLAVMLGIVLVVGLVSSLAAVRATVKAPLLSALRGE